MVDPDKLREQRIPAGDLARLLSSWNVNAPGGDLDTPEGQKGVRVVGQYQTPEDVKSLVIRANERGEGITVADVATVTESLEKARDLLRCQWYTGAEFYCDEKNLGRYY